MGRVKNALRRAFAGKKDSSSPGARPTTEVTRSEHATTPAITSDPPGETAVGLKELSPGVGNPTADIIFVHGLRGARMDTWSHQEICWPRDFLKEDLSGARVFTFGWDAMIANLGSYASQESLFGHAETLLTDLEIYRENTACPVIFVAHSLGGLLVKQALIRAKGYQQNQRHGSRGDIALHTKGVIFMGTPHRGSEQQAYGQALASIAKLVLHQPNNQLLEVLHRESAVLENQRDEFVTISKELDVVCFREELPTGIGLIVPQWSAVMDGFKVQAGSIHANHMDMTKFRTRDDSGYKRVLYHIRRQLKESGNATEAQRAEMIKQKILPALSFDVMHEREERIDPAFDKTCDWLLASGNTSDAPLQKLRSWLSSESEPLLWISGKAGSGKSTLMKFLAQEIADGKLSHAFIDESTIIAKFFIYRDEGEHFKLQMTREGMVRSILHQCLKQEGTWVREVFPELGRELPQHDLDAYLGTKVPNWKWLDQAFSNMLATAHQQKRKILLLIDGLDEYRILHRVGEYTQKQLDLLYDSSDSSNNDDAWGESQWIYDGHVELVQLLDTFKSNKFAKVCVSSRELNVFEAHFRNTPRIRVQEHTATGIAHYCKTRLEEEAPDLDDMAELVDAVNCQAQGVFLWVRLVVGLIIQDNEAGQDAKQIRQLIDSLPDQLGGESGLYWRMLQHIPPKFKQQAVRMLYIMAEAESEVHPLQLDWAAQGVSTQGRPSTSPTASELQSLKANVALLVTKPTMHEDKAVSRTRRKLQSHCLGLLELCDTENCFKYWADRGRRAPLEDHTISQFTAYTVRFMHSTARDFLLRDFVRRRLHREAFNAPLALLDGALLAFRNSNSAFTRWLLTSYGPDISLQLTRASEAGEHASAVCSAFESLNSVVRTVISTLCLSFRRDGVVFCGIHGFWNLHPFRKLKEGGKDSQDTDDISLAVHLGLHTVVTAQVLRYAEPQRSRIANSQLSETVTPLGHAEDKPMQVHAPWKLIDALLRLGASLSTEVSVPVEERAGLGTGQPQWAGLTVWVYLLGLLGGSSDYFCFRESDRTPWIRGGTLYQGGSFGLMDRMTRTCTTRLFGELLHHGPPVDFELQFMSLEFRGSDPPESEMSHWHRAHVEGWWYKWGEVKTSPASKIIQTACGDVIPRP